MKKIQSTIILLVCTFLLTNCIKTKEPIETTKLKENDTAILDYLKKNNITAQKSSYGFYYNVSNTNAAGRVPVNGDLITYKFSTSRLDNFKIDSTTAANPGYDLAGTLNSLLKEGEKGTFFLPFNFAYGADALTNVPAYSPIRMDYTILKIRNEEEQIEGYITDNKFKATKTDSGLRYEITSPIPAGEALKNGQSVTVKYTGKLLYYSRIRDAAGKRTNTFDAGTFQMVLGANNTVAGFEEGISKFKVGEKGVILFPSKLGYKAEAKGDIPALSPLFFEIEIVAAK